MNTPITIVIIHHPSSIIHHHHHHHHHDHTLTPQLSDFVHLPSQKKKQMSFLDHSVNKTATQHRLVTISEGDGKSEWIPPFLKQAPWSKISWNKFLNEGDFVNKFVESYISWITSRLSPGPQDAQRSPLGGAALQRVDVCDSLRWISCNNSPNLCKVSLELRYISWKGWKGHSRFFPTRIQYRPKTFLFVGRKIISTPSHLFQHQPQNIFHVQLHPSHLFTPHPTKKTLCTKKTKIYSKIIPPQKKKNNRIIWKKIIPTKIIPNKSSEKHTKISPQNIIPNKSSHHTCWWKKILQTTWDVSQKPYK